MERKHKRITEGMTDEERFHLLENRSLELTSVDAEKVKTIDRETLIKLSTMTVKDSKPILKKIGEEFGVFKDYQNADIKLEFSYSKNGFYESLEKQKTRLDDFAKMLSCFDGVITNAIGIEVQKPRYGKDFNTKNVYILASAYRDDENIVPVKLEVKELHKGTKNVLYVTVSERKIKEADIYGVRHADASTITFPLPASFNVEGLPSKISICQLAKKINTLDEDFLKYFPDQMLSEEQITAKLKGLADQDKYITEKMAKRAEKEQKQSSRPGSEKMEFQLGKTYFDIWYSIQAAPRDDTPSYYAELWKIEDNGAVKMDNLFFGKIAKSKVYEELQKANLGELVELNEEELQRFMDLKYEQDQKRLKIERQEAMEEARNNPVYVDEEELYDRLRDVQTDYFNDAIDKDEYEYQTEFLVTKYKVAEEKAQEKTREKNEKLEEFQHIEPVKHVEPARTVGTFQQVGKRKFEILIPQELIGNKHGRLQTISAPRGEYSGFVFSVPRFRLSKTPENGMVKMTVKGGQKFTLKNDGKKVDVGGAELCAVMAGLEIGKAPRSEVSAKEEKRIEKRKAARELKQSLRQGSGKDVNEVQKTIAGSPAGAPEPPKITQRKSLSKGAVKKPQKLL